MRPYIHRFIVHFEQGDKCVPPRRYFSITMVNMKAMIEIFHLSFVDKDKASGFSLWKFVRSSHHHVLYDFIQTSKNTVFLQSNRFWILTHQPPASLPTRMDNSRDQINSICWRPTIIIKMTINKSILLCVMMTVGQKNHMSSTLSAVGERREKFGHKKTRQKKKKEKTQLKDNNFIVDSLRKNQRILNR